MVGNFPFYGNLNLRKHRIKNLATDKEPATGPDSSSGYIADLGPWLVALNTRVSNGAVYGYVYTEIGGRNNIAALPFGTSNLYTPSPEMVGNGGPGDDIGMPGANQFGLTFDGNRFRGGFYQNRFGQNNQGNDFGKNYNRNIWGDNNQLNSFGDGCAYNTIGSQNVQINRDGGATSVSPGHATGPNSFSNNIIGNNVRDIWLGDNITYCNIGDGCTKIKIGAGCFNVKLINCHANADGTRFVVPDGTTNVTYNNNVIDNDPYGVANKLTKTLNLSDVQDKEVALTNLGIIDVNKKIPAKYMPAGIDDIQEFDGGVSTFPALGEKSIIYVDTSGTGSGYVQYRWSGTAYGLVPLGAGSTDVIVEGVNNLYFTQLRAIGSVLTGYAKSVTNRAITALDSTLIAIGILEKKADDNTAAISTINLAIPATATSNNKLVASDDVRLLPNFIDYNNEYRLFAGQYAAQGKAAIPYKAGLSVFLVNDSGAGDDFPSIDLSGIVTYGSGLLQRPILVSFRIPSSSSQYQLPKSAKITIGVQNGQPGLTLVTLKPGDAVVISINSNQDASVIFKTGLGLTYTDANAIAAVTPLIAGLAPVVQPFDQVATVSVNHTKGRTVFVQIYGADGHQIFADISQPDAGVVAIDFAGELVSGTVILM
jgi:hypothetical protein